jgi:hypothetical protein
VEKTVARVDITTSNIKKHNPRASCNNHITYLELGLGIAGAFFPFSPFPSYPFPKAVVFDILRNVVGCLLENGPVIRNGPEARRAMTSTTGNASADGANRRARCIQMNEECERDRGGCIKTIQEGIVKRSRM